jgi:hypothetical protein
MGHWRSPWLAREVIDASNDAATAALSKNSYISKLLVSLPANVGDVKEGESEVRLPRDLHDFADSSLRLFLTRAFQPSQVTNIISSKLSDNNGNRVLEHGKRMRLSR